LAQQPNKRFATVDELGALAVFLAGDAAASEKPATSGPRRTAYGKVRVSKHAVAWAQLEKEYNRYDNLNSYIYKLPMLSEITMFLRD